MSKERALEILIFTRKLLEDPKRWCAGRWATDDQGNSCHATDLHATCWCLQGAIRRASIERPVPGQMEAIIALKEPCITTVNDRLYEQGDHAGLLRLIDNGIARLSGKRLRLS